jgi:hypothetical protein
MIQSNNTRPIGYWETAKRPYPLANYPHRTAKDLEIDDLKREQEIIWAKTRALYKTKGGKMVSYDDRLTGGSMGLRYADLPLRDECELEIRASRR